MDIIHVVYPNNGLFNYRKEWGTDTYYNMDASGKHAKLKKDASHKDDLLYDSIYRRCPQGANV